MPIRLPPKSRSLATKAAELAFAVPQVVAHRVTRMAMASPTLSDRDRKEFQLMVKEKETAFAQAWNAMAVQSVRASQALTASYFRSMWLLPTKRKISAAAVASQLQNTAFGILGKGLAPVHRKAVANAKRLAKAKLR